MNFPINDGSKILEAFGLNPNRIIRADIHFRPRSFVVVEAEHIADVQDADKLKTEIKKFKLVPIEEDEVK